MKFLVTSDEAGVLKEVVCNRGTDTSKKDGLQPTSIKVVGTQPGEFSLKSRITHMKNYNDKYLITTRLDGTLRIHDLNNEIEDEPYKLLQTYNMPVENSDKPISLSLFENYEIVVIAFDSGKIIAVLLNDGKFDIKPIKIDLDAKKTLETFEKNPYEDGVFAYGGKENDLKIIRLFDVRKLDKVSSKVFTKSSFLTNEIIFSAKNVPNNYLDLRVPVWISKIKFCKSDSKNGYKLITATRYGQIRQYDTQITERPLNDYKISERPILTLNFANEEESEVIVTDAHNLVAKYSLIQVDSNATKVSSATAGVLVRPSARLLGKFSEGGNTGAIFGVDFSHEDDLITFGGLDRYLRLFSIKSRKMVAKVYTGTQISDIVLLDAEEEEEEENELNENDERKVHIEKRKRRITKVQDESDEEELWNQLESENKPKRKQKTSS